jgi:hypothetical protein
VKMRKVSYGAVLLAICLPLTCGVEQRKALKQTLVDTGPKILAAVATAFGAPYAGLVGSFFDIASKPGGEGEPSDVLAEQGYYPEDQPGQEASYPPQPAPAPPQDIREGYYPEDQPGQEASYPPEPGAAPLQDLEVQIDVVKEAYVAGQYQARTLADGDTLTQNDNYKIMFQCNMRCYMYIVQLDSSGKMDPIFPSSYFSWGNPTQIHTLYSLPPQNKWFYLDENTGVETIYFIASRSRRLDLEQLFRKFEEKNKSLVQLASVSLDSSYMITRGIGGVREGRKQTVNLQDGSQGQYASTLFSSIQADLVVTRWFYHQ